MIATSSALLCQPKLLGNWEGDLGPDSMKIKIILHIIAKDSSYKSFIEIPGQGSVNIPLGQTQITGDSLIINDSKFLIAIKGFYNALKDSIDVRGLQYGKSIAINFGRSSVTGFTLNRPQTPKPPFPYSSEEVVFANANANNIKLAGTLTVPMNSKIRCAAILITGSGPQNRNEKAFDHETFLILSDYLSRNGIAVLRFDDRGVAQSEGAFKSATTYDFSTDVEAALDYLRKRIDIPIQKIGLIGHSEGGMIAPMVAARRRDVAFVVCLAGPGVPLDKLQMKQNEEIAKSEKQADTVLQKNLKMHAEVFASIKEIERPDVLESKTRSILEEHNFLAGDTAAYNQFVKRNLSLWFRYLIRYNPADALEHMSCPLLALNGTLDKQVDATMNLEGMRTALKKGKNPDFTLLYMPGLNHLFQEAKTGDVAEYVMIEQTMSPKVLEAVTQWIQKRF